MGTDPLRPFKISAHHIGGRANMFQKHFNLRFKDDFDYYVYDADPNCLEDMEQRSNGHEKIITAAVAGGVENRTFNVNYDPYTSSLLKRNVNYEMYLYNNGLYDYIFRDVADPVEEITLTTTSLDNLADTHGFSINYLNVDTQGSEFEIISGASEELFADTVAVISEVSFVPFYEGQKLGEDVIALLRGRGFFPIAFQDFQEWDPQPVGIGWRGTGFQVHGDILFFRSIEHVIEHSHVPFTNLLKLAFIALSYQKISYALECLTEAFKHPEAEVLALGGQLRYIRFLDELYALYGSSSKILPLRFPHWKTKEQSMGLFDINNKKRHSPTDQTDRIQAIKAYFQEADVSTYKRELPKLLSDEPTPFESLLRDHDFLELAEYVARKRKYLATRLPAQLRRK